MRTLAVVRDNGWGLSKPPIGSVIDWGKPISRGLVHCSLFNEGYGHIYDLAQVGPGGGPKVLGPGSMTYPASGWAQTRQGPGLKFTKTTTEGIKIGLNSIMNVGSEGTTLLCRCVLTNGTGEIVAAMTYGNTATGPCTGLFPHHTTYGGVAMNLFNGGDGTATFTHTYPSDATVIQNCIGVTFNDGFSKAYFQGVPGPVSGTSKNNIFTGYDWYMGNDVNNTTVAFRGIIIQTAIWRRVLTEPEIRQLQVDPYAMIQIPSRIFVPTLPPLKTWNSIPDGSIKTFNGLRNYDG